MREAVMLRKRVLEMEGNERNLEVTVGMRVERKR
jgi:hypothetical protein